MRTFLAIGVVLVVLALASLEVVESRLAVERLALLDELSATCTSR